MVRFEGINSKLITFLERCACKGVVLVTATGKTSRNFFNYFYMDVEKDQIAVKAIDSEERKMFIRHFLKNVDVQEIGIFAVTDSDTLLEILRAIPRDRKVKFETTKDALLIETIDTGTFYGFKLRQMIPSEDTELALKKSKMGVDRWDKIHTIEEGYPKVEEHGQSAVYDTVIYFDKGELQKVIDDSVKLTRDQDLRIQIKPGSVSFSSGKKADNIIADVTYVKEVINPIEVDKIITNLHPIVNHLFGKVILYCRMASDGALKYWVASENHEIELNFCSGSV